MDRFEIEGAVRSSFRGGTFRVPTVATTAMALLVGLAACAPEAPDSGEDAPEAAAVPAGPTTAWSASATQGVFEVIGTNEGGDRLVSACPTPAASPTPRGQIFLVLPDGADEVVGQLVFSEARPFPLSGTQSRPEPGFREYVWTAPSDADFRGLLMDLEGADGNLIVDVGPLGVRQAFSLEGSWALWADQRAACGF